MTSAEFRVSLERLGLSQRQLALAIRGAEDGDHSAAAAIARVNRAVVSGRVPGELALAIRLLECVQAGRDLVGR